MTNATPKKDAPAYAFAMSGIPNTPEGRAAIALIKKHTNHARFGVRVRANGPRNAAAIADGHGKGYYHQSLPQKHAQTFRIYFDDESTRGALWKLESAEARARDNATARDRLQRDFDALNVTAILSEHAAKEYMRENFALRTTARDAETRAIRVQRQLNEIPGWILYACGLWTDIAQSVRAFVADMKADR